MPDRVVYYLLYKKDAAGRKRAHPFCGFYDLGRGFFDQNDILSGLGAIRSPVSNTLIAAMFSSFNRKLNISKFSPVLKIFMDFSMIMTPFLIISAQGGLNNSLVLFSGNYGGSGNFIFASCMKEAKTILEDKNAESVVDGTVIRFIKELGNYYVVKKRIFGQFLI